MASSIFNSSNNEDGLVKGKVLFFNVDASIVSILKKEFLKSEIVIYEESDESSAKKLIKKEDLDIVLSDYDPHADNPTTLFEYIKKKHASVNRIYLSETDHERKVMQLVLKNIATSYFEKPHGIGDILESVSHILGIRKILKNKKLIKLLSATEDLSSYLKTYYDFSAAIEEDKSPKEIAAILEKDVSIATKVLKIANSAFYRSSRIGSLERACIYLGLDTVKNIVFTVSLSSVKRLSADQNRYLDRVIYHSLKVNQNFQRFYQLETGKSVPPNCTSIGITHDIGKIIMLQYMPDRYQKIIKYQKKNADIGFYRSEIELGYEGTTHTEIGAYFLDLWNFPEESIYTTLFHHTPEETFDSHRELMDIFSFVNEFAK
jgi:HD-like signal output (HDOD) protein